MKKIAALILSFVFVLALSACSGGNTEQPPVEEAPPVSEAPETPEMPETPEAPDKRGEISVGFLKGPTGMGAAYFMEQAESGAYGDKYGVILDADPSAAASALVSGELDIACLPTNVAASLYNKTGGKVRVAAVNTLGVLYILENGDSVSSVADLAGKTVYATGQGSNPEYVLNYILSKNGLAPGEDVTVEYLASDELTTRMASGELDICMLPVPAATTVMMKNQDVREALDLTEEWSAATEGAGILTQGCIAVGENVTDEQISDFLTLCRESADYMTDENNLEAAATLAEKHGIVGSAAIAKAAMSKCGITFMTGADSMRECLSEYFYVLYEAAPSSIGGSVPDDGFYWEA